MRGAMQTLAEWSPMAWALNGFHTVMLRDGGFSAILPDLLKLLACAALAIAAASWLNRSHAA